MEINKRNAQIWSMLGPSGVLGVSLDEIGKVDEDLAVLTADLCFFSGLERFKLNHPNKFYNVGIAEQNMIGIAAGMAKEGMNVFATTYATFASMRVLDQVKVAMGYMELPVKLIGLTAGFSAGILGATHMALEDIAVMRAIPNMIILSPADCTETMKCIMEASKCSKPVYIRLSGTQRVPIVYDEEYDFKIGKAVKLYEGNDIAIIATGSEVYEGTKVVEMLRQEGIYASLYDFHTIKPLDEEAIRDACKCSFIVTIEEHSKIGGLGSAVAEVISGYTKKPQLCIMGTEDRYLHAASSNRLIEMSGLDAINIKNYIIRKYKEIKNYE